jgi:polyhydroxyalkanoate synthesis repressor PhaR
MKIIKRYKNRRLYDCDKKKFITHTELRSIIKAEEPFRIFDSHSGHDITLAVLGRLLTDDLKSWQDVKGSRDILVEIINQGGTKSVSVLKNTFLASVGIYNLTKKKAEEVIDMLIKTGKLSKSERKEAVMELLDRAEASTIKMKDKVIKESGTVQKEISKLATKVKQATDMLPQKKIMAEIEKLNKKVDKLAKALNEKKGQ